MKQARPMTTGSARGAILLNVLAFVAIISFIMAGVATFAVSHFSRSTTEASYASALDVAEAGVNAELRKISVNWANADQLSAGSPQGVSYAFGVDSYSVYCMNVDGSTPWVPPNRLFIVCSGSVNGVSRTLKVMAKGLTNADKGKYAIYTISGTSVFSGAALTVQGDVGTNGLLNFNGSPSINGTIYFNGWPTAGWSSGDPGTYSEVKNISPVIWPTVSQIANQMFPLGGLTWLALNNDNLTKANPPIVANTITSSTTLTGPGNFYVTNISLSGTQKITFDNTNGPVNVWLGPPGGSGSLTFVGGAAAIARSTDPNNQCTVYCATLGGVTLKGTTEMDASVYAYNVDASGNPYGTVNFGGTPVLYGQVLGNTVNIHGTVSVNYIPDGKRPLNWGVDYFGFANSWREQNAL